MELTKFPLVFVKVFIFLRLIFQKFKILGRHICGCQARIHNLIRNCLNCGRVVCEQEGSGPCFYCGTIVCTREERQVHLIFYFLGGSWLRLSLIFLFFRHFLMTMALQLGIIPFEEFFRTKNFFTRLNSKVKGK